MFNVGMLWGVEIEVGFPVTSISNVYLMYVYSLGVILGQCIHMRVLLVPDWMSSGLSRMRPGSPFNISLFTTLI